jgi:hypothetical protein
MTFARKTQSKYGAQIPTGQKPGTKQASQGKPAAATDAPAKAAPEAKGGGRKKA